MKESLKLAEQLRDLSTKFAISSHEKGVCNGAIQELRRLEAVNAALFNALQNIVENGLSTSKIKAAKDALGNEDQKSTCNKTLHNQGKAYPRTCKKCGLGPCIGLQK